MMRRIVSCYSKAKFQRGYMQFDFEQYPMSSEHISQLNDRGRRLFEVVHVLNAHTKSFYKTVDPLGEFVKRAEQLELPPRLRVWAYAMQAAHAVLDDLFQTVERMRIDVHRDEAELFPHYDRLTSLVQPLRQVELHLDLSLEIVLPDMAFAERHSDYFG